MAFADRTSQRFIVIVGLGFARRSYYNRANEAGGVLKPGDFDWKAIFGAVAGARAGGGRGAAEGDFLIDPAAAPRRS